MQRGITWGKWKGGGEKKKPIAVNPIPSLDGILQCKAGSKAGLGAPQPLSGFLSCHSSYVQNHIRKTFLLIATVTRFTQCSYLRLWVVWQVGHLWESILSLPCSRKPTKTKTAFVTLLDSAQVPDWMLRDVNHRARVLLWPSRASASLEFHKLEKDYGICVFRVGTGKLHRERAEALPGAANRLL